jgi:hypothetical protein
VPVGLEKLRRRDNSRNIIQKDVFEIYSNIIHAAFGGQHPGWRTAVLLQLMRALEGREIGFQGGPVNFPSVPLRRISDLSDTNHER